MVSHLQVHSCKIPSGLHNDFVRISPKKTSPKILDEIYEMVILIHWLPLRYLYCDLRNNNIGEQAPH